MYVTSKYLGETKKKKYFFYLLYEDYVQTQMNYVKELEKYIERFGRNLQQNGGVIKPFIGDIEQTKEVFITLAMFVHGYASIIANNSLAYDEKQITAHLKQVYTGAILAMQEEMK